MRTEEEIRVEIQILDSILVKNEQKMERHDLSEWDRRDIKFENTLINHDRNRLLWVLSND